MIILERVVGFGWWLLLESLSQDGFLSFWMDYGVFVLVGLLPPLYVRFVLMFLG